MAETDTAAVSVLHADTMRSADMMNHLKILVHISYEAQYHYILFHSGFIIIHDFMQARAAVLQQLFLFTEKTRNYKICVTNWD
jgi:hypothetical protein